MNPLRSIVSLICGGACLLGPSSILWAASQPELGHTRQLYISGQYQECIDEVQNALANNRRKEDWHLLWIQSLMALGRYPEALQTAEFALRQDPYSVQLRLAAHDVFRHNSRPREAAMALLEINSRAGQRLWAYRQADDMVAIGKAILLLGADPKQVLDRFFDFAIQEDPQHRDGYLAKGELALEKHDFELAAEAFQKALERFPEDADVLHGLALAYAPSDRKEAVEFAKQALKHNPRHVPSFLLLTDHLIDAEEYDSAHTQLGRAIDVNPWHPQAWAYRAVLGHLAGNTDEEVRARQNGLRYWTNNPAVDHLIGRKLSQKYRFAEGAAHQRRALEFDPDFLPAKIQLAQDLLRLGRETEGWRLAEEVHQADPFDVTAYNLATLRDTLVHFQTLTNAHFTVRMSSDEAKIYGDRVLDLLERARSHVCTKYGFELNERVTVEIFPEQKDFGVRTFGMPDNPGFLGVCFGPVITANSPASQEENPANWEAVLWHEFCHVVTLGLTRNKMPRWLSEGISVYEEVQANPVWGQPMNPHYRQMILDGELSPISELSAAFLTPPSSLHLQFAYFQSYLAVDFLIRNFGLESLKRILVDLGDGTAINDAIEKHTQPLKQTEEAYRRFAREQAELFGPGLDWEKPKETPFAGFLPDSLTADADNFYKLMENAQSLLKEERWNEAKEPLRRLIEECPEYVGTDSAYPLLAAVHRALDEVDDERRVLAQWAAKTADATAAYLRLMELASEADDWRTVLVNANRFLAANPLLAAPYRYRAQAAEKLARPDEAIESLESLLLLDPPDPADLHFRLATLLCDKDQPGAKRHVLQALEEAPRFREAHRLLLALVETGRPVDQ